MVFIYKVKEYEVEIIRKDNKNTYFPTAINIIEILRNQTILFQFLKF